MYSIPEGKGTNYNDFDNSEGCSYDYYIEMATGASNNTKLKNIYDMAGNMNEWTTEYGYHDDSLSGTKYVVIRGGSFRNLGNNDSICARNGDAMLNTAQLNIGFRVVLYVK